MYGCFQKISYSNHNNHRGPGILLQSGIDKSSNWSTLSQNENETIQESQEMKKARVKAFECRPCRPEENKTLRRAPRETSADDLWVETISAPCNIHHGKPLSRLLVKLASGTFQRKEEQREGVLGGECPAKSLMGYRVP